jgi:phenylacetate-CoA ligase
MINLIKTMIPPKMHHPLANYYRMISGWIPKELRYHRDYFTIINLHQLAESGKEMTVNALLSQRLALILKSALTYVPYYRETVKINPNDIHENIAFDVLMEFPYLSKETVMQQPNYFLDERYPRRDLLYATSGGSTGQGIGVWFDRRESQVETAFFDYEWGKFGYTPSKSRVVRFGTEARKREDEVPWNRDGNRLLISPYHLDERWLPQIYVQILEFRPDFFHAYPSCLEIVARFIQDQGLPPIQAKGLFLASEAFTEYQYMLFKKTFIAPIKAHYGLTERTNLAFMYEDDDKQSFFYRMDPIYGFSENLSDEYGNQEIVGTSYWNCVMPLIRYRTQDFGRIESDGTIRQLDGRSQEYLFTKNGAKIPGFSIKIDEFTWDYVKVYQVVQERRGTITIKIVPRPNFNEKVKERLLEKQTERWGGFFDISLEVVENIPRTPSGKHRLIVNNIVR